MKIELKKISFSERMSDETNCFIADLYIDDKKVGYCKNDGGGCTEIHGNTEADNQIIAKAEEYCKTLPPDKFGEQSLEDVVNDFLENYLKAEDLKKFNKKMQKKFASAICYGKKVNNGYVFAESFWRGKTLAQIPLPLLQSAYNNVKATKLLKGDIILNDNLEALGVKL